MSKAAGTTQAWPICSRVLAGLLGGYVFTYALTAALAQLLPLDRVDALLIASGKILQINLRNGFGQFDYRRDSSAHHSHPHRETEDAQRTDHTTDNEYPPHIIGRSSLDPGNVKYHIGWLPGVASFDNRNM